MAASAVLQSPPPATADLFRQGMRRLAGACTIITSRNLAAGRNLADGRNLAEDRAGWVGMTATAVASVTAEPPRLLVCVNRSTFAHGVIAASGVLGVNVLGADGLDMAKRFAGGVPPETRFAEGAWQVSPGGAPLLASALAGFDCAVAECVAASSHDIFICDVLDVRLRQSAGQPLIYFDGAFLGGRGDLQPE